MYGGWSETGVRYVADFDKEQDADVCLLLSQELKNYKLHDLDLYYGINCFCSGFPIYKTCELTQFTTEDKLFKQCSIGAYMWNTFHDCNFWIKKLFLVNFDRLLRFNQYEFWLALEFSDFHFLAICNVAVLETSVSSR